MSISAAEHQEVSNYQDVLNAIHDWPRPVRAALVTDIVATLFEDEAPTDIGVEEADLAEYAPEEMATINQLRQEWEENRRRRLAGEIELDHPRPSPYEGLTQAEALAQMKAEWEENRRRAHENYVPRPPSNILAEIYGIGNAEHPGPSDEEVEQWLHEHKMEKYG